MTSGRILKRLTFSVVFLILLICSSAAQTNYSAGMDTSWFTSDQNYNLILAAEQGDSASVAFFIGRKADVNAETWEGVTPLIYASQNGYLPVVKILVEAGANLNHRADDGGTALSAAIKFNHGYIADYLLLHGADPDIPDSYGVTPLMYAAAYNLHEMADILLYYGAHVSLKDNYGNAALHVAALVGSLETASLLAEIKDSIDIKDNQGFTPLMTAASVGDSAMCALLLEKGASLAALNNKGYDPLSVALINGQFHLVTMFVEHGSDVNQWISVSRKTIDLVPRHSAVWEYLYAAGARPAFLPSFGFFSTGVGFAVNSNDILPAVFLGVKDRRYGLELQTALYLRPWLLPVLTETRDNITYQFNERRFIWTGTVGKNFNIVRKPVYSAGIFVSAGMGYTWGRYAGVSRKPLNTYFVNYSAGIVVKKRNWEVKGGYSYLPVPVQTIAPARLEVAARYSFSLASEKKSRRIIPWLYD
ncbi:MAG: ankyrin repeat domain-containing protein [Bacteroidales bacterium]